MPVSKKQVKDDVQRKLEASLDKLFHIWQEIGIDDTQVGNRAGTVSMHLCNLLDEMVSEEEQLRDQLAQNIQRYVDELSSLCLELSLPVIKVGENVSMVQKEKEMRSKLEALKCEKHERLKTLKQLRDQDQRLCDVLCSTPYYIPSSIIPSREQLHELELHVKNLEAEKAKRYIEFVSIKQKIVALCHEMDYDPDTSFERELICEDDEHFQLSTENMRCLGNLHQQLEKKNEELEHTVEDLWHRIHCLWDRLELEESERSDFKARHKGHKCGMVSELREEIIRCEKLKYANLQRFVEGARRELVDWWNRCYFSKEQRDSFQPFQEENYTEDLLEIHEKELVKMKKYFETHKEILELMVKREKLWTEMLEFEKKASDPNRFFNDRGGKLLMEEKARKKLMKELPRVEEETKENIESWEKENGKPFLVEGVPFGMFVEQQWKHFYEQKETEKQERLKNKAKQMEEEMTYGSKPTSGTPAKRRFINTPTRTPLKARKLNETPRTPASVSRIQHSSIFHSQFSRPPLSAKTPNSNHTKRRRSLRQARKVLQESMQRNGNVAAKGKDLKGGDGRGDLFSQTTVSSGASVGNVSIATMGSYQDFAKGLTQTARPNCRSSVAPSINSSPMKRW